MKAVKGTSLSFTSRGSRRPNAATTPTARVCPKHTHRAHLRCRVRDTLHARLGGAPPAPSQAGGSGQAPVGSDRGSSAERARGRPRETLPPTRARGAPAPSPAAAWRRRTHLHTRTHSHSRTLAQAAWAAARRSAPAPPVRLRHGKPRLRLLALRGRGGVRGRREPRHR